MSPPVLLWFAGYSNLTSIIIVAVCFLAMTIFIGIVRMHGDFPGAANSRLLIGAVQRNMVKVSNPFVVKLPQQTSKLEDGLDIFLSILCNCQVVILWGPLINPLHDLILKPGTDVREACLAAEGELFSELDCQHADHQELLRTEGDLHKLSISCPSTVTCDTLGEMPRKRYPVVVMTFVPPEQDVSQSRNETDWPDETDDPNKIIGLISVIHLWDNKVPKPSYIIGQYVKTAGVPIYSLQSLYLCGNSSAMPHQTSDSEQSSELAPDTDTTTSPPHYEEDSGIACENASSDDLPNDGGDNIFNPKQMSDNSNLRQRKTNQPETESDVQSGERGFCSNQPSTEEANNTSVEQDSSDEPGFVLPECVVCQTRPVMCALLPCRHACVCLGCFKLLTKCPMCRGVLQSYFLLKDYDGSTEEESEEEEAVLQELNQQAMNRRMGVMWENWNERLNEFLGFR